MYHRKYYDPILSKVVVKSNRDVMKPTCDVHTLLKITNTNVCTNQANVKSRFFCPNSRPPPKDKIICGRKLVNGDLITCLQNDNSGMESPGNG